MSTRVYTHARRFDVINDTRTCLPQAQVIELNIKQRRQALRNL